MILKRHRLAGSAFVAVVLLLCIQTSRGQGAAPFWEPLVGPPAPLGYFVLLPDSSLGSILGDVSYVYLESTNRWAPLTLDGKKVLLKPKSPRPGYPWSSWLQGQYASVKDTLFFSTDLGAHWRLIGTFGTLGYETIQEVLQTPTGHTIVLDDSGAIFATRDTFRTVDTVHVPERAHVLSNDGDTLLLTTMYGNLYRSTDFGKNWKMLFALHDTIPNYYLVLTRRNNVWLLTGSHLSPTYPYSRSNVYLGYSLDRGATWTRMKNPVENYDPSLNGLDKDNRIFISFWFLDSTYRSDDWGKSWRHINTGQNTIGYILRDGTLISGNLRSSDHGETWDTISTKGIMCLPVDMVSFGASVALSTSDAINFSSDNGQGWSHYYDLLGFQTPGYLSLRPDSSWIMVNTTIRPLPSIGYRPLCWSHDNETLGVGIITRGFHVWVVQNQLQESLDTGCSYRQYDPYAQFPPLSKTPITAVMETTSDTVLTISSSSIMKGYDPNYEFTDAQPEQGHVPAVTPTGAVARDSTGAIYAAMSDGKLFVTHDGANSWQEFLPSPGDSTSPIQHLAAGPAGLLFAVDQNKTTGVTSTMIYDPKRAIWSDATQSVVRESFPGPAELSNIWYTNGYAWAGTWNMGLFRSVKPVIDQSAVSTTAEQTKPLELYPNPARDEMYIQAADLHNASVKIYDELGRAYVLRSDASTSNTLRLDISGLVEGHYILRVQGPSGVASASFVVKR